MDEGICKWLDVWMHGFGARMSLRATCWLILGAQIALENKDIG